MNKPKLLQPKPTDLRVKSFLQDQKTRTITVVLECHEPTPEEATRLHNLVISEKPVRVVEEK